MLYPIKFKTIYKERIWGGGKLFYLLDKDFSPSEKIGESWEISGLENDVSVVKNGFLAGNELNELIEVYMGDLVGDHVYEKFGNVFPLLVKFLDASEDLSIQVHPDDELAYAKHSSFGKTEFWYIIDAEPDAKIISGFAKKINKESFLNHLQHNTLDEIIKWHKVKKGDVYFIPSGRIHAAGKGNVILEIQQTSDITYRIFDYNRVGTDGKLRELHIEEAIDAIDFEDNSKPETTFHHKKNTLNEVIDCDFFTTNYIKFDKKIVRDYYTLDSFVIYVCISGKCTIHYGEGTETLVKGETILIPAELDNIELLPEQQTELLEVYITGHADKHD